jgi:exodeoxyribonuclease VII large subunit
LLGIPRQRLDATASALPRGLRANTHAHFRRFAGASARLTLRVLRAQVTQARQHLTVSGERLRHGTRSLLRNRRDRFTALEARLKASRLANTQAQRQTIARERERTERLAERAERAILTMLDRLEARMLHSGQLLTALSYRSVLARGFALVRDEAGHPLHAAADVAAGARLELEFSDGRVAATAGTDQPVLAPPLNPPLAPRRPRTPKRVAKSVDQGSLF